MRHLCHLRYHPATALWRMVRHCHNVLPFSYFRFTFDRNAPLFFTEACSIDAPFSGPTVIRQHIATPSSRPNRATSAVVAQDETVPVPQVTTFVSLRLDTPNGVRASESAWIPITHSSPDALADALAEGIPKSPKVGAASSSSERVLVTGFELDGKFVLAQPSSTAEAAGKALTAVEVSNKHGHNSSRMLPLNSAGPRRLSTSMGEPLLPIGIPALVRPCDERIDSLQSIAPLNTSVSLIII